MGWCSATEIMDKVISSTVDAIRWERKAGEFVVSLEEALDRIRPVVAAVAETLRDGDWDCIEESEYFDNFPQEMLGLDDDRFDQWKTEQLGYWDGSRADWPKWAGPLPKVLS